MNADRTWEEETQALIGRLEQDKLPKAQQRLVAAQRAVAAVERQIEALRIALDVYRSEHGLPSTDIEDLDPERAAEFQGMNPKEMLYHWAETHGGQVVMKDASKFLAAAGLFRDETQAAGTLYPTARRLEDFEKVGRGVYRRKPQPAITAQPPAPPAEPVDTRPGSTRVYVEDRWGHTLLPDGSGSVPVGTDPKSTVDILKAMGVDFDGSPLDEPLGSAH